MSEVQDLLRPLYLAWEVLVLTGQEGKSQHQSACGRDADPSSHEHGPVLFHGAPEAPGPLLPEAGGGMVDVAASLPDGPQGPRPLGWSSVSNQMGCMTVGYSGRDGAWILRLGAKTTLALTLALNPLL